jgi:hypothetical protein
MNTFYTNKMMIQVGDGVRLVFQDERLGIGPSEHPTVNVVVGAAVMTMQSARALRDLLVEHVHDEGDVLSGQSA